MVIAIAVFKENVLLEGEFKNKFHWYRLEKKYAIYEGYTGAQPEIFQCKGGFVKLGHFHKLSVKNSRKKGAAERIS